MKLVTANTPSIVFLPPVTGITGDVRAGLETENRLPHFYPVLGKSHKIAPTEIGARLVFRNDLAQATAQAINSWLPSTANQNLQKKEG